MAKKSTSNTKSNELKQTEGKAKDLTVSNLRWKCPVSKFKFKSTEELEPLDKIVGQRRAVEAIRLGAELFSKGYNIFVSGLSGTGRLTTVKKLLEGITDYCPTTYDFCYVNNFEQSDHPRLIKLEQGKGKEFSKAMEDSVSFLKRRLPKLFEEENFQKTRKKIIEEYQQKEKEILTKFDEKIKPYGFIRGQIENQQGINQPEVFPIVDGQPIQIEDIDDYVEDGKISKEEAEKKKEQWQQFHNEIFDLARQGMKLMQEFRKELAENDKAAAAMEVNSVMDEIQEKFKTEKVEKYISEVKEYILDHLERFMPSENPMMQQQQMAMQQQQQEQDTDRVFKVNIILDNSETECAPVVVETTPSFPNLFGAIERHYDPRGGWISDFMKIKAGSILKADQGYLIVSAMDMFTEPGVWPALKRVLLYDKLEVQNFESYFFLAQSHLKPEPINVKVKVIIIGGQTLYRFLYMYEKGFKKIFKINAQFDYEAERTDDLMNHYSRFIAKICCEEKMPHVSPDGVAGIVEWAVEHGGSKDRISLKFSDVADIIREAAFYDRGSKTKYIDRKAVDKAIAERRHRNDLLDEKVKHHILVDNTMIDTEGERVGQINGLTIYDTGILMFGKPARITATVSAGNSGIINIERESDMSGSIHNKGVLIMSGFLQEKFARDIPLSLTASIAFEQSYGGIDGDSASAAEVYVLLSALAEVPIKQNLAITGSINQKGDIQPIGGVNEKIRGFYEICEERGLTGDQGVIIPGQNVKDLMLCTEILDAVKDKKFHVYSIKKIEEGVELLTGMKPGKIGKNGKYPVNTFFGKVTGRLEELHKISKESDEDKKKK